jgi:hypothetical protein
MQFLKNLNKVSSPYIAIGKQTKSIIILLQFFDIRISLDALKIQYRI